MTLHKQGYAPFRLRVPRSEMVGGTDVLFAGTERWGTPFVQGSPKSLREMYNHPVMDAEYGLHSHFTAQAGQGDALAEILLAAAEGLRANEACLLYLVSRSPDDPDAVWVTEVWMSKAPHDASLQDEEVQAAIQRARPLILGIAATELRPVGGKGI